MKRFLPILIVALAVVACTPKQTIETEQVTYAKSFCLTQACNDSLSLNFEVEFPTMLDNKEALAAIQADLITHFFGKEYASLSLDEAINDYVAFSREEYIANNRAYAERLAEDEDEYSAVLSEEQMLSGRVRTFEQGVLSYELEQYIYMGGAHGVSTRHFYNYDTATGRLLTEHDIFRKGFEQELARLLQNAVIEQSEEFGSREEFLDAGFEFDSIHPNGNFALSADAITYVFNPYEIAPYVYGETEIVLDKSLLKGLLKED